MIDTETTPPADQLEQCTKEAFERGYSTGYGYVQELVLILVLSYVLEWLWLKASTLQFDEDTVQHTIQTYLARYRDRFQSNLWTMRLGILLVMVFDLYIFHISVFSA